MRLALAMAAGFTLGACGAAAPADPADQFVGTFSGVATRVLTCRGTAGPPAAGDLSLTFTKISALELSVAAIIPADAVGGTTKCGPATFAVAGSIATLKGTAACETTQMGSTFLTMHTMTAGSVALGASFANATIDSEVVIDPLQLAEHCTARASAVLTR